MSYEEMDRLPDDFWSEAELEEMSDKIVNPVLLDETPKHICWYHLVKDGTYTHKAILLVVESVVDGQEALNKYVEPLGLTVMIGDYSEESVMSAVKCEALYIVLNQYRYKSKMKFNGDTKVFSYENWMSKLI